MITSTQGNKMIRKIIEQFFTDEFIKDLIKYIIHIDISEDDTETNRTRLMLLDDILSEISTQLLAREYERVEQLISEMKQYLNDDSLIFTNDRDTIRNRIMYFDQYRKYIRQIIKKIDLVREIIRLKNNLIEKDLLIDEILERFDKIQRILDLDENDILDNDIPREFFEKVENKIKQLNIKWTELKTILDTLFEYETLITKISIGQENNEPISELVKQINEYVRKTSIELSILYIDDNNDDIANKDKTNKKFLEKLSIVQITDDCISEDLSRYISKNYSSFDTGLLIFDNRLNGIESGSVYLIAAPTNHGKTLFLIHTLYSIIASNINQFRKKDAILFITLEDSNIKVLNRIYSVFGNYQYKHLTQLQKNFKVLSEYIKVNRPDLIDDFNALVKDTYEFIKKNSIDEVTNGNVEIFIQDAREKKNEFSVIDIISTIEQLKVLGYNIKAIFIDYVELMSSTKKYEKEYSEQGQIVIDLRNLANTYMIPVIAATQLNRAAENSSVELTNQVIGDSYNKAKFSDYVIMIRQIKTDIINDITSEENDNSAETSRRKKRKNHPELSEIIRLFMPISETQTRLKTYIQSNFPEIEFPNLKRLLYKKNPGANNNEFTPLNIFTQFQKTPKQSNANTSTDINQYLDDIFTDSKIINELFRLVEYNIPKAKDGVNFPSCAEIINSIAEKIKTQYDNSIAEKIEYKTNYVFDKGLIYPNSRYNLQTICNLSNNYILFSKFNLRIYSIPEIPIAIHDYIESLHKFQELNEFLLSNELYRQFIS